MKALGRALKEYNLVATSDVVIVEKQNCHT